MNKMSDENNRLGGESKNQDVGELGKSIWGKHKYNIRDGYYVISLDENLKKMIKDGLEVTESGELRYDENHNLYKPIFVSKKQRSIAKQLNFGLMYGMGLTTFQQLLQLDRRFLEKTISDWWENYVEIKKFVDKLYIESFKNGYAKSYMGKRYLLPQFLFLKNRIFNNDIVGGELTEGMMNFVNSGTAADWFKTSIVFINAIFRASNLDAHIVNSLHDEMTIEAKVKDVKEVRKIIEDVMTKDAFPETVELGLNVKVSTDVCYWWDECNQEEDSDLIRGLGDEKLCAPDEDYYKNKYFKYKNKYLSLKNILK